jgi:oligo-1,6-glucosidase
VDGDLTPVLADDPQIWAYTRATAQEKLLVIANCGRTTRTVDVGLEWMSAELVLGNVSGTAAALTSTSLALSGWDARIYCLGS